MRIRCVLALVLLAAGSCSPRLPLDKIVEAYRPERAYPPLQIRYPLEGTVFPPEAVPCAFVWEETSPRPDAWFVLVEFEGQTKPMASVTSQPRWTPGPAEWELIKARSQTNAAHLTILALQRAAPLNLLARGRVKLITSKDPVAAPLFYREVNLPFLEAVKDPSKIRWRFGTIDSPQPPPIVLEHLPVCGNCHSFSRDGQTLGMDVDYANNKGSYVVTHVTNQMSLASSQIITWDSYQPEHHQSTYGLLSQVSPDGQAVISTVKDKSVFVPKPDLAFSQLFFPIKGILVVYHRDSGKFQALPGADDPQFVQSNPVWSPDGQVIVFARAQAYQLRNQAAEDKLLLDEDDCAEFLREGKPFQFDLYRLPYNHGEGGKAEPLAGASHNGRSNYFPKYSPDGKWIVFCQARSYMLLQPDSELYIIPAAGGQARRLRCNTSRMNSWHSWSPNGRWLVFSSKANSPYTQLCLTHIDEDGESTPPVLLANLTAPDRAANIPEFVNTPPGSIARIQEKFLDDYSHARAAYVFENSGEIDRAIEAYREALKINPNNGHAHQRLGFLLYNAKQQFKEGLAETDQALRLDAKDGCAHYDLGMALLHQGRLEEAIAHLREAVRLLPDGFDRRYNPADMQCSLGEALAEKGQAKEAAEVLSKTIVLSPKNARAHYLLALTLAAQGQLTEPLEHFSTATTLDARIDTSPDLHYLLSINYESAGNMKAALRSAERALELAPQANPELLNALQERVAACRQKVP